MHLSLHAASRGTDLRASDWATEAENIIVSQICLTWSLAWLLPLSAELLSSAPNVQSDLGHFVMAISALKALTEAHTSDCHLE